MIVIAVEGVIAGLGQQPFMGYQLQPEMVKS
jgi:hypothetical protein